MTLRLIDHTDADALFQCVDANRHYLRQWLPWLDHNQSVADSRAFIQTCLREHAEHKSRVYVVLAANGELSGVCGFNRFNASIKAGYIGYWLAEQAQGQGLISQGCLELERIGFEQLKLNKLEIHAAKGNLPSRAVAERLKYQATGTLLDAEWLYDHYVDHIVYCKRNPASRA